MKLTLLYKIIPNSLEEWENIALYHLNIIKKELLVPDFIDLKWHRHNNIGALLQTSEGWYYHIYSDGRLGIHL